MSELHLLSNKHPVKGAKEQYEALVGIDALKEALVDELILIFDKGKLGHWLKTHHPRGLGIVDEASSKAPLIILSGEVGCGKTALASCVATIVGEAIDKRIVCVQTPSDIRGGGHVGELSSRITEAFTC